MPVSPARAAAFDILLRVERTDAYASELLHSSRAAKLSPADHGLTTEIVMGVLRWRSVLDEQIAAHLDKALAKLDAEVLTALRIGTYQLLFLDRVPAHAAINESVELVKKARKRSAAGMVNAVLRKIHTQSLALSSRAESDLSLAKDRTHSRDLLLEGRGLKAVGTTNSKLKTGGAQSSLNSSFLDFKKRFASESLPSARNDTALAGHPEWLTEKWAHEYGRDACIEICSYDQQTPTTVIRADDRVIKELTAGAIQLEPGKLLKNARVVTRGDITRTSAFREKRLVIQDEGSQLVALLLGHGGLILDCCAAPGGKTRIIAERNPTATVVAMELHPHRATLMQKLVPVSNVHVASADARAMPFTAEFDRILVDAPCTGTGTLARNPEIKWRLKPDDITRMQIYQLEILSAAMKQLATGGQLLYSTCSLEPEENEAVVERALQNDSGFRLLDIHDRLHELRDEGELACDPNSLVRGKYLRTVPGLLPCDGFFAALLERQI